MAEEDGWIELDDKVLKSAIMWRIEGKFVEIMFVDINMRRIILSGLDVEWLKQNSDDTLREDDIVMRYLRDFEKLVLKYDKLEFTMLGVQLVKAKEDVTAAKKANSHALAQQKRSVRDAIQFSQKYPADYRERMIQLAQEH